MFEGSANAQNGKLVAKGRLSECVLELYSDGRRIVTHVSDEMDGAAAFAERAEVSTVPRERRPSNRDHHAHKNSEKGRTT